MKNKIQTDAYCKKVLGLKSVASYVIHGLVKEFEVLTKEELEEILDKDNPSKNIRLKNTEDITKDDAKIVYDLLSAFDNKNEKILVNLEPQGRLRAEYQILNRGTYTVCRMIVSQKNDPDGFQGDEFDEMKKCVSIWIVLNAPAKYRGSHVIYSMNEDVIQGNYRAPLECIEKQRIIILFLYDEVDLNDTSLLMMLSVLFSTKVSQKDREFYLREKCGIVITEGEWKEYEEMSDVWEGFYANGYDSGYGIGYDSGYDEGNAKGNAIGNVKGVAESAMNLMKNCSIDLETAMKNIGVSEEMKPHVLEYIRQHTTN